MKILHVLIPDYYLTVERARRRLAPEIDMVIHFPETPGFVVTQSSGAEAWGVKPAMMLEKAQALVPEGTFLEADFQTYSRVSEQLNADIRDLYPFTEQIDAAEWFCDLTDEQGTDFRPALENILRAKFPFDVRLGVSRNKFLAKLGNDTGRACDGAEVRHILAETPIDRFWGIPQKWIKEFRQMGIATIGEVGGLDPAVLEKKYPNAGLRLVRLGQGEDDHEVHPFAKPTRLSRAGRIKLTADEAAIRAFIQCMAEELSEQLQKGGHAAFTIFLDVTGAGQKVSHRYRFVVPTVRSSSLLVGADAMLKKIRSMLPDNVALDLNLSVCEIVPDRESYQFHGSPRADFEVMRDF